MARNDKRCVLCRRWKNRSEFNKRKSSSDGLQTVCRTCNAKRSKQYYRENREKHLRVVAKRRKAWYAETRRRMDLVKRTNGCVFCKEREPVALDFHHVGKKEHLVSRMISEGCSWSRIVREISACAVVCASCHRKVTAGILKVPRSAKCEIPEDLTGV